MVANFFITAAVLSCVITCRGRSDTTSPGRNARFGPVVMCACAVFSTMVWPMVIPRRSGREPNVRSARTVRPTVTRDFLWLSSSLVAWPVRVPAHERRIRRRRTEPSRR